MFVLKAFGRMVGVSMRAHTPVVYLTAQGQLPFPGGSLDVRNLVNAPGRGQVKDAQSAPAPPAVDP